ncbi:MAG: 2-amino-4-hydroxy-6-hydroxymethyldihydropteridine diphosphokinase [Phycisphaerae bacterium]
MDAVRAYIAIGGNLGDRYKTLRAAVDRLDESAGVRVRRVSTFIETDPVGGPARQGRYLNAAAEIETTLSPEHLLETLQQIEAEMGRNRTTEPRWGARTCDLDILLYDDRVVDEPGLTIPHPRMHQRLFVIEPLAEIAPHAIHPVLKQSVQQILQALHGRN